MSLLIFAFGGGAAIDNKSDGGAEAARLKQELDRARAYREAARVEARVNREEYERSVAERERRARRDRAERIAREDPDRGTFWRRELSARFGRRLLLKLPARHRIVLIRHKRPLRFHGLLKVGPRYRGGVRMLVPGESTDLTQLLLAHQGHYLLLAVPWEKQPLTLKRIRGEFMFANSNGRDYKVINIYSDGVDILLVETEHVEGGRRIGNYSAWPVESVEVVHP